MALKLKFIFAHTRVTGSTMIAPKFSADYIGAVTPCIHYGIPNAFNKPRRQKKPEKKSLSMTSLWLLVGNAPKKPKKIAQKNYPKKLPEKITQKICPKKLPKKRPSKTHQNCPSKNLRGTKTPCNLGFKKLKNYGPKNRHENSTLVFSY